MEKISRLHLTDPQGRNHDGNLLKQLLTGEIDDKHMHHYEENVIRTRGGRDSVTPPSLGAGEDMDMGFGVTDAVGGHLGMDLFSDGAAGDMDSLLTNDVDVSHFFLFVLKGGEEFSQEMKWIPFGSSQSPNPPHEPLCLMFSMPLHKEMNFPSFRHREMLLCYALRCRCRCTET